MPAAPPRPRLLIATSIGGQAAATALRTGLDGATDITLWVEGEPAPSARAFDAAAFVLCDRPGPAAMLRLGVFLAALGRERIVVCPVSSAVELHYELHDLAVAPEAPAVLAKLRHLTEAAQPAAPRRHRSIGAARSTRPEASFRIADISLTGAFLETFGEIPEGQTLELTLELENGKRLHVDALVVRIQHPQWGRVGGVGVRFVRFAGNSHELLERFLDDGPAAQPAAGDTLAS